MSGKSVLFLVVGFSLIFLLMGKNFGRISIDATKNYSEFYSQTVAKNIAESGANLAVNQIYLNPAWTEGFSSLDFENGKINVAVSIIDPVRNIRLVTSTGTFNNTSATVQVTLSLSYFSKYAYCSNTENGIWWATGDTVNGPFHTQDYLNVNGTPVFNPGPNSYVSTFKGLNKADRNSKPKLINTVIKKGDNLPIPTNGMSTVESMASTGGHIFSGENNVYIIFDNDYVKYRFKTYGSWTKIKTSSLAPNGTIVAVNSTLHIQGVVKGQVTIGATGTNYNQGNIYIDDDIVYASDPRIDPNSTDLLGIVASKNIYITNNTPNRDDIKIDGAIYSEDGGFGAEDYDSRPYSGSIILLGGITQGKRAAVGVIGRNGRVSNGFNKSYNYDKRLRYAVPPNFPSTNSYQIVSWYE